jgi:hypothetical protein
MCFQRSHKRKKRSEGEKYLGRHRKKRKPGNSQACCVKPKDAFEEAKESFNHTV